MQKLSAKNIYELVSYISENISVYAGKDNNQRILIKPGLKLTHKKTGLNYTVDSVKKDEDSNLLSITYTREPGIFITITSKDLKEFERT